MSVKRASESSIANSEGINPIAQIEATGGTVSTITDGGVTYKLHAFTSDGTFSVSSAFPGATAEVLLVGAGGSGGYAANPGARYGGGGGGGGFMIQKIDVTAQNYTVTVGQPRDLGSRTGGPSGFLSADESVRLGVGGGATHNTDGANGGGRSYNNSTYGRGVPPTGKTSTGSNGAGPSITGTNQAGITTNFTGTSYYFAQGGNGGQNSLNNATRYGEGGEGPAATSISNSPRNGFQGVVYVRYKV